MRWKSWIGCLAVIATDHPTGGVLLPDIFRAERNESDLFPEVVARRSDTALPSGRTKRNAPAAASRARASPDGPPRFGLAWQRLRAAAAWFIEWLWLSRRVGWLDGHDGMAAEIIAPTAQRLTDAKAKTTERLKRLRAEGRQRLEREKKQRAARA